MTNVFLPILVQRKGEHVFPVIAVCIVHQRVRVTSMSRSCVIFNSDETGVEHFLIWVSAAWSSLFLSMSAHGETPVSRRLSRVKHVIIVCSGKGGVGKSSVSVQVALSLYASSPNVRVGILDVDLTGPSIPRMLGLDGHPVHQSTDGWVPVYADGSGGRLACMSVAFLLKKKDDSVVWRGPKKNAMIRQFLSDVRWGELDYLIVDTPPGELFLRFCWLF